MSVNLLDGAKDLYAFLSVFTSSAHPETAKKPWSITGESMGGHYVTAYTQYIVQQQRERADQSDVLDIDVETAIIVDGYIDNTRSISGYYDFLCLDWRGNGSMPLFDREKCEAMEAGVAKCETEGARCRETYDIDVCIEADTRCNDAMGHYFWDEVKEGGLDPYDGVFCTCSTCPCSKLTSSPSPSSVR
jgi:cathepsin A (carboxypeptidase C)